MPCGLDTTLHIHWVTCVIEWPAIERPNLHRKVIIGEMGGGGGLIGTLSIKLGGLKLGG